MRTFDEFFNEVDAKEAEVRQVFDEAALDILSKTGDIDREWLSNLGYYTIDEYLESEPEEGFFDMADENDMKMFESRGGANDEGYWLFVFAGARIENGKPVFRYAFKNEDWDEWEIDDELTFEALDEKPPHYVNKREAMIDLYTLWDEYQQES